MITVVIQGGLGNQLFQYAYGRALMEEGKDVVFDISFFETNTKYTKRSFLLLVFKLCKHIITTATPYKQHLFTRIINKLDVDRKVRYVPVDVSKDTFIADGYYNTEKYFKDIRELLLQDIVLVEEGEEYKKWKQKIKSAKNPLMVHARRADYIQSGFVQLGKEYYNNALKEFDDDCTIFAFSDDIDWLNNTLGRKVIAVSGQGLKDYEELMLMASGKYFVIANSTFSWWGAWLSNHPGKKVVAPKRWFANHLWYRANNDVVPEDWIRV